MKTVDFSGKTVEDAVKAGLKELGLESGDVTIDVLEYGSPGLFGMFGKLARVRLTVKEKHMDDEFEMPVFSLDAQEKPKPEKPKAEKPKAEKPKPQPKPEKPKPQPKPQPPKPEKRKSDAPETAAPSAEAVAEPIAKDENKPVERKRAPRKPREPREPREPRPAREARPDEAPPAFEMVDLPETDYATLSETGKLCYDFLKQLTSIMHVDVEIRLVESEGHINVQLIGDTLGVLIGRRGETLDAVQYLTSLQVNKGRDEYIRVSIDTEHYRAKREEALKRLAERMANRARRTGHRVTLEPMNPYERRVLHSALQSNAYVTTHSEGEEPYRRVVITLK